MGDEVHTDYVVAFSWPELFAGAALLAIAVTLALVVWRMRRA